MNDTDYILGTHDAEIERLGLQHRVWRPHVLEAWRVAGISIGHCVLDVGCGPGFATMDLAEIVGPVGRVIAVDRSSNFLRVLQERIMQQAINHVEAYEADLDQTEGLVTGVCDAAWCRWVLSFATRPQKVVDHMATALKPGGVAIFYEYLDYRSWRLVPPDAAFDNFVGAVMESWRDSGGEPDIAMQLPTMLAKANLDIVTTRPIIDVVTADNYVWQWPRSFVEVNLERLVELGRFTLEDASHARQALYRAEESPHARMVTPCLLEVIARKR